jgi:hypothetical protein
VEGLKEGKKEATEKNKFLIKTNRT